MDEFSSKMGDDQDIIVLSFFVRDKSAAKGIITKNHWKIVDKEPDPEKKLAPVTLAAKIRILKQIPRF